MTVMPSLRLSLEDAQDIASYLITPEEAGTIGLSRCVVHGRSQAHGGRQEVGPPFGCAGCHEISGFEDEGRIGTELTQEGSKPIERLDFALFTDVAQRGGKEPITDPEDLKRLPEGPSEGPVVRPQRILRAQTRGAQRLRQGQSEDGGDGKASHAQCALDKEQIRALTTFLLGSQETSLPDSYQYRAGDSRRDIQEGWWIVKKYNCTGCHQFIPGQSTMMQTEALPGKPRAAASEAADEGARVDPEWLRRFLSNPALSTSDTNRNGVRPYLAVRMPTFYFSDNELRKLVRFFQALSQQPMPYIPERFPAERKGNRHGESLFTSTAAPCLKCHATGDPEHDRTLPRQTSCWQRIA